MKLRQIKRRTKTAYVSLEGTRFVRDCVGKQCRTYEAGCTTCDGWRFFRENGRFVRDFSELRSFMNYTENERVEKFIHDPSKAMTAFTPPKSLLIAELAHNEMCGLTPDEMKDMKSKLMPIILERRLGDVLLDEADVMRNFGATANL